VRIIASIEDPDVIAKILSHLDLKGREPEAARWSAWRPNAGVDGCDQAIQLAEKAFNTAYTPGGPRLRVYGSFIVSPFRDRTSPGKKMYKHVEPARSHTSASCLRGVAGLLGFRRSNRAVIVRIPPSAR